MMVATTEFIKEVDELTAWIMQKIGSDVFSMDEDEFLATKRVFELLTASKNLLLKQAKKLDTIEEKLDLLLEKTES